MRFHCSAIIYPDQSILSYNRHELPRHPISTHSVDPLRSTSISKSSHVSHPAVIRDQVPTSTFLWPVQDI